MIKIEEPRDGGTTPMEIKAMKQNLNYLNYT